MTGNVTLPDMCDHELRSHYNCVTFRHAKPKRGISELFPGSDGMRQAGRRGQQGWVCGTRLNGANWALVDPDSVGEIGSAV